MGLCSDFTYLWGEILEAMATGGDLGVSTPLSVVVDTEFAFTC